MSRTDVNDGHALGLPEKPKATMESLSPIHRALAATVNPDGSLTPAGIRALLDRNEVTLRQIAEPLAISEQAVSAVIKRRKSTRRIQDAIAAALGLDANQMWGRKALAS